MNWLLILFGILTLCLWTWVILMAVDEWFTAWHFFGGAVLCAILIWFRNYYEEKKDKELWK